MLHAFEGPRWSRRRRHSDSVDKSDEAAPHDDAHDPGPPDNLPISMPKEHVIEESRLKPLDLGTRVAQPRYGDEGLIADQQDRSDWKGVEIDSGCCDVLAEVSWVHLMSRSGESFEQLGFEEVNLPQVRLCRISPHA